MQAISSVEMLTLLGYTMKQRLRHDGRETWTVQAPDGRILSEAITLRKASKKAMKQVKRGRG